MVSRLVHEPYAPPITLTYSQVINLEFYRVFSMVEHGFGLDILGSLQLKTT
jgi:hypothetical protein